MEKIGQRGKLLESPIYSAHWNAVFYIDIDLGRILKYDIAAAAIVEYATPRNQLIGCIAETDRHTVIAAIEDGIYEFDPARATFTLLQDFRGANIPTHFRPNDGVAGPDGALYFGTMTKANVGEFGAFFCYSAQEGLVELHNVGQFRTINGLAFTGDGRTLYMADSFRTERKVWKADFDAASGDLTNKRLFLDMGAMIDQGKIAGRPDGAVVDTAGNYWVCGVDGAAVYRFSPQGTLMATIPVPGVSKPTKIAVDQAGTMFITTIALEHEPDSGFLFRHHLPEAPTMVQWQFRSGRS